MELRIKAFAKINLALEILGRLPNGYHQLKMIMQSVDCHNLVTVKAEKGSEKIVLSCNAPEVPCDSRNTAYRAAELFLHEIVPDDNRREVSIIIEKGIPDRAGVGGSSSDAAAVLRGLDKIYQTHLSDEKFCELGVKIGADVPFCTVGGTKLAEGIGEQLTDIVPLEEGYFLLIKPKIDSPTGEAFSVLDTWMETHSNRFGEHITACADCMQAISEKNAVQLGKAFFNHFEEAFADTPSAALLCQTVQKLRERMLQCGALGARMTGSGSTVFGYFREKAQALACREKLCTEYPYSMVCAPVSRGWEFCEK